MKKKPDYKSYHSYISMTPKAQAVIDAAVRWHKAWESGEVTQYSYLTSGVENADKNLVAKVEAYLTFTKRKRV